MTESEIINRQKAEIERLREVNSLVTEAGQEWQKRYKTAKAKAIKEFAKRLKKALTGWDTDPTDEEIKWVIDNLVKEMVGDNG